MKFWIALIGLICWIWLIESAPLEKAVEPTYGNWTDEKTYTFANIAYAPCRSGYIWVNSKCRKIFAGNR